jgi:hypothetical protein
MSHAMFRVKTRTHDPCVCQIKNRPPSLATCHIRTRQLSANQATYNLVVQFHPRFTIKTTCSAEPQYFPPRCKCLWLGQHSLFGEKCSDQIKVRLALKLPIMLFQVRVWCMIWYLSFPPKEQHKY